MKTKILASILVGGALVLSAKEFKLIITHSNGDKTEISTDEIVDMQFEEVLPEAEILATPYVNTLALGNCDFLVQWSSITGAASYQWTIDGGTATTTTSTEFKVYDLEEGTHPVTVTAISGSDNYTNSEAARVDLVAKFNVVTTIEATTESTVKASVKSNSARSYYVAIVPASIAEGDRVAHIEANSQACQRKDVTGSAKATVEFTGLNEGDSYNVVCYATGVEQSFATACTTSGQLQPGAKGSVFPNGVSLNGGFYDVDKVGDTYPSGLDDRDDQAGKGGGDNDLCWACTAAGLCQWWLDEYKRQTGNDYPLTATLPSHGIYSTDIMEAIVRAFPDTGGDARATIKWFFAGVKTNSTVNELKTYNENYENWRGGFLGMTEEEALSYFNVSAEASDGYIEYPYIFSRLYSTKGLSLDQAKKKFAHIVMDTLREGPAGLVVPGHSLAIWGCDYEVDTDGEPVITTLYIGENGRQDGNVKNGLNECKMMYTSSNQFWFYLPSMYDGGSVNTTLVQTIFGLKGYKAN